MNKLIRNIIILVAVLAVIAGGFWWLMGYEPSTDTEDKTAESSSVEVYKTDSDNITSVTVEKNDKLVFTKHGDAWGIEGYPAEKVSSDKVKSLISTISYISSDKPVTASKEECGLNAPTAVVTVNHTGGVDIIKLGALSSVLDKYFFTVNDGEIYTMSSYKADSILSDLSCYTSFSRLSIASADVFDIKIQRAKNTLHLKQNAKSDTFTTWVVTEPFKTEYNANEDYINNSILTAIDTIDLSTPADIQIATPTATVTLLTAPLDENGVRGEEVKTIVLKIGNTNGDIVYVEYNGEVFEAQRSAFDFVNADEFAVVSKLLSLTNISSLNRLTVTADDKMYVLDITHSVIGKDGDEMTYTINGKVATEKKAKAIYQKIIGMPSEGQYRGERLGEMLCEFKFESENTTKTITFSKLNDLYASYTVNGQTEFTVKLSTLKDVIEKTAEFAENPA